MYWVGTAIILVIGFLSLSVGLPLITIGLALVVLAPLLARREIYWSVLSGVIAFNVVYIGLAPGGCTTYTGSEPELFGRIGCENFLGLDYSGYGDYAPPFLLALGAGLLAGLVVWLIVYALFRRRRSRLEHGLFERKGNY
jgi:hypothetical protein